MLVDREAGWMGVDREAGWMGACVGRVDGSLAREAG